MDDFGKYIDKHPLRYYSLGPSGVGVKSPQPFTTEWVGWFEPGSGFRYLETTRYNLATGYFSPYAGRQSSQTFSFTFDSGNAMYFALGDAGQIFIRSVSGASTVDYNFSGYNPMMFNNSVLTRGANQTNCFYTKTYNEIYCKTQADNFATERLVFSGTSDIKWFTQVANTKPYTYRYQIFGMTNGGDGKSWMSSKHPSISTGENENFESLPTGATFAIPSLAAEVYAPSGRFFLAGIATEGWFANNNFENYQISGRLINPSPLLSDDFQRYEVAEIGTFDTISGMRGGRTHSYLQYQNDNFESYAVGPLFLYLVGADVYRGYFIYG